MSLASTVNSNHSARQSSSAGLSVWSALAVFLAAMFTGIALSVYFGVISTAYLVCFSIGAIAVTLLVNVRALFVTVSSIPFLFGSLTILGAWTVTQTQGSESLGAFSATTIITSLYPFSQYFPWVLWVTISCVVIAIARILWVRRAQTQQGNAEVEKNRRERQRNEQSRETAVRARLRVADVEANTPPAEPPRPESEWPQTAQPTPLEDTDRNAAAPGAHHEDEGKRSLTVAEILARNQASQANQPQQPSPRRATPYGRPLRPDPVEPWDRRNYHQQQRYREEPARQQYPRGHREREYYERYRSGAPRPRPATGDYADRDYPGRAQYRPARTEPTDRTYRTDRNPSRNPPRNWPTGPAVPEAPHAPSTSGRRSGHSKLNNYREYPPHPRYREDPRTRRYSDERDNRRR